MPKPRNRLFTAFYRQEPDFTFDSALTAANLRQSHKEVRATYAADLEEAYLFCQADLWSPHGEALALISALGLQHTSMSVGDVLLDVDSGTYFQVDYAGFKELPAGEPEAQEPNCHGCPPHGRPECSVCHVKQRYCRGCGSMLSPDGICPECDAAYLAFLDY